jgi:hypothetical protein
MKLSKTSLDDQLRERSVTDVYVVGLATDVCVGTFYLMIKTKFLSYFETLFKLLQQCMLLKIIIELY